MNSETAKKSMIKTTAGAICRSALISVSILYTVNPLLPTDLSSLTGFLGLLVMISAIPLVKPSYGKPALVFLILSFGLMLRYHIAPGILITGINSMLSIVSIMTALQLFIIPIRAGGYDQVLERYLKGRFSSESSLYVFISLIAHMVGSFMLFGTVPMLYAFFGKPLKEMVREPDRFAVTAIGRSFTLATLWAPGAVSVVLTLESTGADWIKVLLVGIILAVLGLVTSVGIESATVFKGKKLEKPPMIHGENSKGDNLKILTLFLIAGVLLGGILILDMFHLLSGSGRVIAVGVITAAVWMAVHSRGNNLKTHLGEYWHKSLSVVPDLAAMFLSMGIFTAVIRECPFMQSIQDGILSLTGLLGPFSFLILTPFIVLLSLTGIHPFIGVVFMGTLLSSALPEQSTMIALALLLGSAVSYSLSPFAGSLITLARFARCSPATAAFTWNGLFSLIFLAEGFALLTGIAFFFR